MRSENRAVFRMLLVRLMLAALARMVRRYRTCHIAREPQESELRKKENRWRLPVCFRQRRRQVWTWMVSAAEAELGEMGETARSWKRLHLEAVDRT